MSFAKWVLSPILASACLYLEPAHAEICDYRLSKIIGPGATGGITAAGAGLAITGTAGQAAGFYTLTHSTALVTMLGSTAAGSSGAGTVGIIAGTGSGLGFVAGLVMSPAVIFGGVVLGASIGISEGVCYFTVERVDNIITLYELLQNVSRNDEALDVVILDDGAALIVSPEEGEQQTFMLENLYIEDGNLMHRDWFSNTNLGQVGYIAAPQK